MSHLAAAVAGLRHLPPNKERRKEGFAHSLRFVMLHEIVCRILSLIFNEGTREIKSSISVLL